LSFIEIGIIKSVHKNSKRTIHTFLSRPNLKDNADFF